MSTARHSATDVVFTHPSSRPFEAMPVGAGDLTAMVRVGASIELHLGMTHRLLFGRPLGQRFRHAITATRSRRSAQRSGCPLT